MRFDAVTLFPEMFDAVLDYGITRRALDRRLYRFKAWNPRDFTDDPHRTVDDRPYGGGPGMLMLAAPLDRALNAVHQDLAGENLTPWVVHFSPRGRPLTHQRVMELKEKSALVLLCGRYEGIDERVRQALKAEEISIGPYVLTDGDVAAMVVSSAVIRLMPGVIRLESLEEESHWNLLLKKEKDSVLLSEKLATIMTNVGIDLNIEKLKFSGFNKKLIDFLTKYQMNTLAKRLFNIKEVEKKEGSKKKVDQIGLF